MTTQASYWTHKLQLLKHPEGGYYREIYRSDDCILSDALPNRYFSSRCLGTCIYYLLEKNDFSAFHRLKSDELWHYLRGDTLQIYTIAGDGVIREIRLGGQPDNNESFTVVIPRNTWFAARSLQQESFALIACTVMPGFEFEDFELGMRAGLSNIYPQHIDIIQQLTRQ